jgi:hypothetical protein
MKEFRKILTGRGVFNDQSELRATGGPPPGDKPLLDAKDSKELEALTEGVVGFEMRSAVAI